MLSKNYENCISRLCIQPSVKIHLSSANLFFFAPLKHDFSAQMEDHPTTNSKDGSIDHKFNEIRFSGICTHLLR